MNDKARPRVMDLIGPIMKLGAPKKKENMSRTALAKFNRFVINVVNKSTQRKSMANNAHIVLSTLFNILELFDETYVCATHDS